MNLRYLGDALDHWKGSIFDLLRAKELLQNFAVDAMASDAEDWQPADWDLLARLLHVPKARILSHSASLMLDRRRYFGEIGHRGDLFLDPDTGVATKRVRSVAQYVRPNELNALLDYEPDRIVAVYQHIRAQKTRERLHNVITALRSDGRPFSCCSYESGTVAMIFLSGSPDRIDLVHREFEELLGAHAHRRIFKWRHLHGA